MPGRDRAREQVADLAPVAVDRRHEDVRRPVAVELQDQLGEVGLERVDPGVGERVRSGRSRRSSATSSSPPRSRRARARRRRRPRSPRPRRTPSAPARPLPSPPPRTATRYSSSRASTSALIARPASRSSSQSGSSPTTRGALGLDRVGRRRAGWRGAARSASSRLRRLREGSRSLMPLARPGSRPGAACARGEPRRREPAADLQQARGVDRGAHLGAARLELVALVRRASPLDVSAFLSANVPPKPQHSSARANGDQLEPAHVRGAASRGASPTRVTRSEWQVGW